MSRRVLVLNQFALPRSRGGGTRHVELFEPLRGWDATIVVGNRHYFDQTPVSAEGIVTTVPVNRFEGNGLGRVLNWATYTTGAFVRGLRRRVDLVYGSSPHLGAAIAGLTIARIRRVPFVLEVRDLWPHILAETGRLDTEGRVYSALKVIERHLYRSSDRIVVLAEGTSAYIEAEGIDPGKLVFIPNGADVTDFVTHDDRRQLRDRWNFTGFTVVYAGAHGPANGLDLVLDAAEQLRDRGVDAHFVFFGDGVSKEDLVRAASERQLDNVEFRAPVPKSEIPSILAAADAGLHCLADVELFKHAVSPNKLYDYMAAGLPAITNTGGDVGEMVESTGSGLSVPPDGIDKGVEELMAIGERGRAELGAAGRRFVREERSRSAMSARLERLLDELV